MGENDDSDGLEDLQELMAEYKQKEPTEENKEQIVKRDKSDILEASMEKIIFGDKEGLLKNLACAVDKDEKEENSNEEHSKSTKRKGKKRKPVWTDADDEDLQLGEVKRDTKRTGERNYLCKEKKYKDFLRQRFERIVGAQPKWASLEHKELNRYVDSDDEELLRTVGFLGKPSGTVLLPTTLAYKISKPLNAATRMCEGDIISIQFHPTSTAALVSGRSGYSAIYSVDGRRNEKLHTIHFKDFPLKCVHMTPCGTKAIFGANKPYYYFYDLLTAKETRRFLPRDTCTLINFQLSPCGHYMAVGGRDGELHLFDANSNELIHTFKQENLIRGMRFTADSQRIISNSNGSNVTIYNARMRRIEHSFIDEGCINGSVLDLSPDQRLLATGSKEGIVNVYDFESVQVSKAPVPIKCFLNLTTSISDIKFNHSSQLLAMSSNQVDNAIKLGHFPSGTVYSNFPGLNPNLGKINTIEFSPGSGYLAFGSRNKSAPLYRLKHFSNY